MRFCVKLLLALSLTTVAPVSGFSGECEDGLSEGLSVVLGGKPWWSEKRPSCIALVRIKDGKLGSVNVKGGTKVQREEIENMIREKLSSALFSEKDCVVKVRFL